MPLPATVAAQVASQRSAPAHLSSDVLSQPSMSRCSISRQRHARCATSNCPSASRPEASSCATAEFGGCTARAGTRENFYAWPMQPNLVAAAQLPQAGCVAACAQSYTCAVRHSICAPQHPRTCCQAACRWSAVVPGASSGSPSTTCFHAASVCATAICCSLASGSLAPGSRNCEVHHFSPARAGIKRRQDYVTSWRSSGATYRCASGIHQMLKLATTPSVLAAYGLLGARAERCLCDNGQMHM